MYLDRRNFLASAGASVAAAGLIFFLDFTAIGWLYRNGYFADVSGVVLPVRSIVFISTSLMLAVGAIGLLASEAVGTGWRRKLAICGTFWVILGALSYTIGSIFLLSFPGQGTRQIFTPLGSLLLTLGMLKLGIAVATAGRWRGWKRFVPLIVGIYFPLQLPIQIIFFLGAGKGPNPVVLGLWGLFWTLLGFAIMSDHTDPSSHATMSPNWEIDASA